MIENADYASLTMLKDKISAGRFNIVDFINRRIREIEMSHSKCCPVCGNDILAESASNYTMIFGPESFKRKASFCAVDCLSYFIEHMKKDEKNRIQNRMESSIAN